MSIVVHLIGLPGEDTDWLVATLGRLGVTGLPAASVEVAQRRHSSGALVIVPWVDADTFFGVRTALLRAGFPDAVAALLPEQSYSGVVQALRQSAIDVLARPLDLDDVRSMVEAMQRRSTPTAAVAATRSLAEMEKDAISSALAACRGQVALTARRLGIGRSTLYRKIELYGITNAR